MTCIENTYFQDELTIGIILCVIGFLLYCVAKPAYRERDDREREETKQYREETRRG